MQAELDNHARLYAFDLKAGEAAINTYSFSDAEVYATDKLKAMAHDNSEIEYKGEPFDLTVEEKGLGSITREEVFEIED